VEKTTKEELCDLYLSRIITWLSKSGRMIWSGHVARIGDRKSCIQSFKGKPEGKRSL
jgi:ribosomal protein L35AE/L33A